MNRKYTHRLHRAAFSALTITFGLLIILPNAGCDQFEDPVADGPDAPPLRWGVEEENPAQPMVSQQYEVNPPANSSVLEISEDGDIDPILGTQQPMITVPEDNQ